jgi:hypothetical protein
MAADDKSSSAAENKEPPRRREARGKRKSRHEAIAQLAAARSFLLLPRLPLGRKERVSAARPQIDFFDIRNRFCRRGCGQKDSASVVTDLPYELINKQPRRLSLQTEEVSAV